MRWMAVVVCLLLGLASSATSAPRPVALLIGIDKYAHVDSLGGPFNDVMLMKQVLILRYGFDERDIVQLGGQSVTRKDILAALDQLAARADGANVLIYFAGHGTTVPDPSSMAGTMSALVPSEAPRPDVDPDGFLQSVVSSRELRSRVDRMKAAHVTLIFDSCHSGAMGRRDTPGRTREIVFPMPATRGSPEVPWLGDGPFTVLAACRTHEKAAEADFPISDTEGAKRVTQGRFTRALAETLMLPQVLTYGEVLDQTGYNMGTSRQHPQLRGDAARAFLTAQPSAAEPSFRVVRSEGTDVVIEGGTLQGVTTGSLVTIQNIPGEVVKTTVFFSQVKLQRPLDARLPSRAMLTARQYGDARLRVRLEAAELASRVQLPALQMVTDGSADVTLRRAATKNVRYEVVDDQEVLAGNLSADSALDLLQRVARSAMVRELRNDMPSPIRLTLHEAIKQADALRGGAPLQRARGGAWEVKPGDKVVVRMHNTSARTWYVTLLDVTPDARVYVQYPVDGGEDNRLGPDESYDTFFEIDENVGRESFIAIATLQPVDLAHAVTRGRPRGDDPLARLLSDAMLGTRAAVRLPPTIWATTRLDLSVQP